VVQSSSVTVRLFRESKFSRTGPGPGLWPQSQKTGPDWTFKHYMFTDMISEGVVVVYLDDILIFTKDLEEHRRITHRVLGRLAEHQLYLQSEKCEFEKTRIEYLGLIISENRVEMDPVKVAGVAEWPEPSNKREVQSLPMTLSW
jgi:hypothetical protein